MKLSQLTKLLIGAILSAIYLSSCNNSQSVTPEAIPVQLDGEEEWSLMTLDGDIIAENEFIATPSPVFHERFIAGNGSYIPKENEYDEDIIQIDGLYIYDINNPTTPINDESFINITNFCSGYAYGVREGTGILVIDRNGNIVKELSDDIVTIQANSYNPSSDLLIYTDYNNKHGYITPTCDIVIKAAWDEALPFYEGKAFVKNKNGKWICINETGDIIFKLKTQEIPKNLGFKNDWIIVEKDNRQRLINQEGEIVNKFNSQQTVLYYFDNNRAIINNGEDQILIKNIDLDKSERIKKFKSIVPIGNDGKRFVTKKSYDSDWIIVDENGENIGDHRFEKFEPVLSDLGIILASESADDPYQIYDFNGDVMDKNLELARALISNHNIIKSLNVYNKESVNYITEIIIANMFCEISE